MSIIKPPLRSPLTQASKGILNVMLLSALTLCMGTLSAGEKMTIVNPYDGVSWEKDHRHKANFHTHTTNSDGKLKPHEVVDAYQKLGYDALAITDHNEVTYPWTEFSKIEPKPDPTGRVPYEKRLGYEDRDPEKVGMTSIQGNEFSHKHHMVNLWTDSAPDRRDPITEGIVDSKKKGGHVIFAHPGRYGWDKHERRKAKGKRIGSGDWTIEKYAEFFKTYDHIIGLEVYNKGDAYPQDRRLWDEILKRLMPERPVWGFSNDDMHNKGQLGRNQSILLVKEPSKELIKQALAKGQFFFAYCPKAQEGSEPPTIEKISVDVEKLVIRMTVDKAKKIEWISNGKVVGTGPSIDLSQVEELGNYVRAMVYGPEDDTVIGTQPFGIVRNK
ncbi:MAG: PHP domain-containing protein [Akkermansiaceae bacterium]|nr:PHP domain-containing protein [Akkermansiaceae bacterium]